MGRFDGLFGGHALHRLRIHVGNDVLRDDLGRLSAGRPGIAGEMPAFGGGAERQVIEILRLIDRSRFEPLLYLATRSGELLPSIPSDVPIFAYRDEWPAT